MNYLKYRESDGYVVSITEEEPETVEEGYDIAESDSFEPGDEFEYWISIYTDEIEDGVVTSHAAVRQAPPAQELLEKLSTNEDAIDDTLELLFKQEGLIE